MKKWLITILALLTAVIFVGCQEKTPSLTTQLGCFTYPGTDWGMTADEFFIALNTSTENFTETNEDNVKIDVKATSYLSCESLLFWGRKVDMKVVFSSMPYSQKEFLRKVIVEFQEPFTHEEYSEFCAYLEQLLQEQESKVTDDSWLNGDNVTWIDGDSGWERLSEATIGDIPEEMKEKVRAYYSYQQEKMAAGSDYRKIDYFEVYSSSPLTKLTTLYMKDKTVGVTFEGDALARMLACVDAYDVLLK